MVYNGKTLLKWMIWGYHHFRKPPFRLLVAIFSRWVDALWVCHHKNLVQSETHSGSVGDMLFGKLRQGFGQGIFFGIAGKPTTMGTQNLHFSWLYLIYWGFKTFIFHGFGVQG